MMNGDVGTNQTAPIEPYSTAVIGLIAWKDNVDKGGYAIEVIQTATRIRGSIATKGDVV